MRYALVAAVSAVLVWGCRSGPQEVSGEESPFKGDFRPTGQVAFSGRIPNTPSYPASASFNAERVVGPRVNASRRGDGTWGGLLYDQPITVDRDGAHIVGSGVNINVKTEEDALVVGGYWLDQTVRIVVNDKEIRVTHPNRSFTLPKTGDGLFGERGELRLEGEATDPLKAPEPQLALALLAIM